MGDSLEMNPTGGGEKAPLLKKPASFGANLNFWPPLLMFLNCITSPAQPPAQGIDGNLDPCLDPISGASDQLS